MNIKKLTYGDYINKWLKERSKDFDIDLYYELVDESKKNLCLLFEDLVPVFDYLTVAVVPYINKYEINTLAVGGGYLFVNPMFWDYLGYLGEDGEYESPIYQYFVLMHETYHIIFDHAADEEEYRKLNPPSSEDPNVVEQWHRKNNIAQDYQINALIETFYEMENEETGEFESIFNDCTKTTGGRINKEWIGKTWQNILMLMDEDEENREENEDSSVQPPIPPKVEMENPVEKLKDYSDNEDDNNNQDKPDMEITYTDEFRNGYRECKEILDREIEKWKNRGGSLEELKDIIMACADNMNAVLESVSADTSSSEYNDGVKACLVDCLNTISKSIAKRDGTLKTKDSDDNEIKRKNKQIIHNPVNNQFDGIDDEEDGGDDDTETIMDGDMSDIENSNRNNKNDENRNNGKSQSSDSDNDGDESGDSSDGDDSGNDSNNSKGNSKRNKNSQNDGNGENGEDGGDSQYDTDGYDGSQNRNQGNSKRNKNSQNDGNGEDGEDGDENDSEMNDKNQRESDKKENKIKDGDNPLTDAKELSAKELAQLVKDIYGVDTDTDEDSDFKETQRNVFLDSMIKHLGNIKGSEKAKNTAQSMLKSFKDIRFPKEQITEVDWKSVLEEFLSGLNFFEGSQIDIPEFLDIGGLDLGTVPYEEIRREEPALKHLVICLDNSGSVMGSGMCPVFLGEVYSIIDETLQEDCVIDFIQFDEGVVAVNRILHKVGESENEVKKVASGTGRGTNYVDCFKLAQDLMDPAVWYGDNNSIPKEFREQVDEEGRIIEPAACTIVFTDSDFFYGGKYYDIDTEKLKIFLIGMQYMTNPEYHLQGRDMMFADSLIKITEKSILESNISKFDNNFIFEGLEVLKKGVSKAEKEKKIEAIKSRIYGSETPVNANMINNLIQKYGIKKNQFSEDMRELNLKSENYGGKLVFEDGDFLDISDFSKVIGDVVYYGNYSENLIEECLPKSIEGSLLIVNNNKMSKENCENLVSFGNSKDFDVYYVGCGEFESNCPSMDVARVISEWNKYYRTNSFLIKDILLHYPNGEYNRISSDLLDMNADKIEIKNIVMDKNADKVYVNISAAIGKYAIITKELPEYFNILSSDDSIQYKGLNTISFNSLPINMKRAKNITVIKRGMNSEGIKVLSEYKENHSKGDGIINTEYSEYFGVSIF